mgnify:FL=1
MLRVAKVSVLGVLLGGCVSVNNQGGTWTTEARANLQTRLGMSYLKLGRLEPATEALAKALTISPNNSNAHHSMAILQLRLNDVEAAERHFLRAVKSDSSNYSAYNDFGGYLCKMDRIDEGLAQFRKAQNNPYNAALYISQLGAGMCYLRIAKWVEAEQLISEALKSRPKLGMALYQMGRISYARGQHFRARGYLQRLFDMDTRSAESLALAVRNELKLGAKDLVKRYAQQLRSEFPGSPESRDIDRLLTNAND